MEGEEEEQEEDDEGKTLTRQKASHRTLPVPHNQVFLDVAGCALGEFVRSSLLECAWPYPVWVGGWRRKIGGWVEEETWGV